MDEQTEYYIDEMRESFRNNCAWFVVVTDDTGFWSYVVTSEENVIGMLNEMAELNPDRSLVRQILDTRCIR